MATKRGAGFAVLAGTATALDFFMADRSDFFVMELLLSEGTLDALAFVPILYT